MPRWMAFTSLSCATSCSFSACKRRLSATTSSTCDMAPLPPQTSARAAPGPVGQLSVNESIPLRGLVGHSENLRLVARRQQTSRTTQSRPAVCRLAVDVETLHQRLDRATAAANRIDVDAGNQGQVWNGGPGRSEICVHRRRRHTPTGHAWFLICPKLRGWTFAHTENEPPSKPKRNVRHSMAGRSAG